MKIVLIGQPNCGKSTLFNQVAGYKAQTGNFPGTTLTFTKSKVRVAGQIIELIDLPGTYTLAGTNTAEQETFVYITGHAIDLIINVVDASHLNQGLTLTLELLELGIPLIVALNMMDEAARLGMQIDGVELERLMGVPFRPLVASKGRGIRNLFTASVELYKTGDVPKRKHYSVELEHAIDLIVTEIDGNTGYLKPEMVAIKLLEGNGLPGFQLERNEPGQYSKVVNIKEQLIDKPGYDYYLKFNQERKLIADDLVGRVVEYGEKRISRRDRLDNILLHPIWGYVTLVVILLIFFEIIYGFGKSLEGPLLSIFEIINANLLSVMDPDTLLFEVVSGLIGGIQGGVAIVLPYLVPFLLGLSFLEDVGYLPRVAFLADAFMHRIGLHGKAVVPFILGYGCSVPAVMSTRLLEEPRDRFLAAALATMVPCAARLAVVFGLVAFYLGPRAALGIYVFNLFVIAVTGRILSGMLPEDTPGMILEMPVYRLPTVRTVFQKSWFRVKEFIVEAWPILIVGSVVLSLLIYLNVVIIFNFLARPITWVLGLPFGTGVPLIFGVLRKELSLIMLQQALGIADFSKILSTTQMITYTVFVVFYVPCLATLAVLRRELSTRDMLVISSITVIIATIAALIARGISEIIFA